MLEHKALVTISLFVMGGATTGTAAYLTEHPRAFTHRRTPPAVEAPRVTVQALRKEEPVAAPKVTPTDVLTLEPVVIESRVMTKPKHTTRITTSVEPQTAKSACSEWRGLETGPSGRKVRMLCP